MSNFSLIIGVNGAVSGHSEVFLAGASSMSLGGWTSVKSQQEIYENQMLLDMEELKTNPEVEKRNWR